MAGPMRKLSLALEQAAPLKEGEVEDLLRPLQNVQGTLKDAVDRINKTPWTTSRLTDSTTFTVGQIIAIKHRLGRVPVRWIQEDVTGSGYGAFKRTAWDALTITIQSSYACTALFRVE